MISDYMKEWAEMIGLQEIAPTTTTDIHLMITPRVKPLNKKRRGLPGVKVSRLRVKHKILHNVICTSFKCVPAAKSINVDVAFTEV